MTPEARRLSKLHDEYRLMRMLLESVRERLVAAINWQRELTPLEKERIRSVVDDLKRLVEDK